MSKVETDITKRWEKGMDHHPMSEETYKAIETMDWEYGNDYFCWKSGGDGDNGEHLMYLLDIYYEQQDEENIRIANATSTKELVAKYEKTNNPVTRSVYRTIIGKRLGLIEDE